MSSNDSQPINERRQFVRVMDAVGLEFDVLPNEAAVVNYSGADRRSGVRVTNKYDINGYAAVKRDFSEVADYIDRLEERIRQLSVSGALTAEMPSHKVRLSAGGLAFSDRRLLLPGDKIGIQLTLFPELTRIRCKGKLVAVEDLAEQPDDGQHFYRVEFYDISVPDQELIEEHVTMLRRSTRQADVPLVISDA